MIKLVDNSPIYYKALLNIQNLSILDNDKMSSESFLSEFSQSTRKYFVALNDDKVCGYIGLFDCDSDYNIISFAVLPELQRRGIGTKLFSVAKDFAIKQNKKSMSLEVDENNQKALSFYKKQGFVIANVRKKYYKNSDALVMFLYF